MPDLSGIEGIGFFLLVICVGYFFVEVLGDAYKLPNGKDMMLEKIIHYIIIGVFCQFTLVLFRKTDFFAGFISGADNLITNFKNSFSIISMIMLYSVISIVWAGFLAMLVGILLSIKEMFGAIKKFLHMDITHVLSYLPIPMLHLYKLVKKVTHHFTMTDWAVAKIDLVVVGLLLAKIFPVLTSAHRGWYVAIIILAEIYFIQRIRKIVK